MEYSLIVDGLVRFRDMIYVPDNSEIKRLILSEFYAKLYLGNLGSKDIDCSEAVLLLA